MYRMCVSYVYVRIMDDKRTVLPFAASHAAMPAMFRCSHAVHFFFRHNHDAASFYDANATVSVEDPPPPQARISRLRTFIYHLWPCPRRKKRSWQTGNADWCMSVYRYQYSITMKSLHLLSLDREDFVESWQYAMLRWCHVIRRC